MAQVIRLYGKAGKWKFKSPKTGEEIPTGYNYPLGLEPSIKYLWLSYPEYRIEPTFLSSADKSKVAQAAKQIEKYNRDKWPSFKKNPLFPGTKKPKLSRLSSGFQKSSQKEENRQWELYKIEAGEHGERLGREAAEIDFANNAFDRKLKAKNSIRRTVKDFALASRVGALQKLNKYLDDRNEYSYGADALKKEFYKEYTNAYVDRAKELFEAKGMKANPAALKREIEENRERELTSAEQKKRFKRAYAQGQRAYKNPSLRLLTAKAVKKVKGTVKSLTPAGRRAKKAIKRLVEFDSLPKTSKRLANPPMTGWPTRMKLTDYRNSSVLLRKVDGNKVQSLRSGSFADLEKIYRRLVDESDREYNVTGRRVGLAVYQVDSEGSGILRRGSAYKNSRVLNPKKFSRKNPAEGASQLYEDFHGKPSEHLIEVAELEHHHGHLAELGKLTELIVDLHPFEKRNRRQVTMSFEDTLASPATAIHVSSSEDGKQIYFVGGDQSIDLKALGFLAADMKDFMYLGQALQITYRTRKGFDEFKKFDYFHGLGEVSKVRPQLVYKPRDKKLMLVGGQYKIEPRGIVN